MENILLSEYQLTETLTLKNRIVMAPMTRVAVGQDFIPTAAMVDYYARRADAGLIITEGTVISPTATGYRHAPGIFTEEQIAGWRQVTDKVHQQGGLIFCQIWHVGRVSHPDLIQGETPIAPSATLMTGSVSRIHELQYGQSRAASQAEIKQIINDFATAAKNAIKAGFDGVEIHGANGYLIDQFLHHHTNLRDDAYGQTPENMARFALEVVHACIDAIGHDRVAIRLSPVGYVNQMASDHKDAANFAYLLTELNHLRLAYVHTGNFDDRIKHAELGSLSMTEFLRQYYQGNLIAAGSYSADSAAEGILQHKFDLVAIGRPFIANPDLINKIQQKQAWQVYDTSMLKNLY